MSAIRPRRPLSPEERRLWAEVARSLRPLPGRASPPPEPAGPAAAEPSSAVPAPARDAVKPSRPPPAARPAAGPRLAPLERRVTRALARGQVRPDAVLDLHGLTQDQAHGRLSGFLRRAQASGHGLVLVITGRGDGQGGASGRGVLRRLVPLWLRLPDMRGVVLGLEEAGPRQGGAGALYVRVRRARAGA